MLRLITRTSAVLVAVALAVPAASLAQGAGDQQYSDPFTEGESGGGGNSGSGSGGNAGSDNSGNSGSGSSAPTQTPSQSATTTPTPEPPQQAQAAQGGEQLPRTGYPVWLAVLAGGVLLASGAMLRVSLGLRW
jgi:hypothetical protein